MPDFVGFLVTFAPTMNSERKRIGLAVLAAALGYFVDAYDLILYNIVRVQSLRGIGVPEAALLGTGVDLLNAQLIGMLVGGVLWGVLGDRRGRRSVLFGSIFLYSAATLANGLIHTLPAYRLCRLLAGVGLAGELGAGVTLVAELLPKQTRGYGTMIVAAVGVIGVVTASLVAGTFTWRTAYLIGGGLGILLLFLRIGVTESGLFAQVCERPVSRGNFFALFTRWATFKKYLSVVMVALPIWVIIGVLITFSPELGRDMGLVPSPQAGRAVLWYYLGLTVGDLTTGYLSQRFANRKRVMAVFLAITGVVGAAYFTFGGHSLGTYYGLCWALGWASGYWAVFITMSAEQFGTNLRATVATTAPNFVRGATVPITIAFRQLGPQIGMRNAAILVAALSLLIGAAALRSLDETYGKDLDFVE
jgi:MFS transporter, putative metabolite:H+ symporter